MTSNIKNCEELKIPTIKDITEALHRRGEHKMATELENSLEDHHKEAGRRHDPTKYRVSKMDIIQAALEGKKIVLLDPEQEYKSLAEILKTSINNK